MTDPREEMIRLTKRRRKRSRVKKRENTKRVQEMLTRKRVSLISLEGKETALYSDVRN